ncbi:hypothetical protein os1_00990 [Comamonadaceae bacterium OS-1]|nr:hypothetical protein os1_00990 [Comamonadaceae bacterium OS-1]
MSFEPFNWTCSVCGRPTTVVQTNIATSSASLDCGATAEDAAVNISATLIECPNPECLAQDVSVDAHFGTASRGSNYLYVRPDPARPVGIGKFRFIPSVAKPLSGYVPRVVQEDYAEANLILQLSPKSAAALARRALQGMIRDYWGISKGTLADELKATEDKCDPELYLALQGIRAVGNIAAHPERDVNLIVDIEVGEAESLIEVIHLLDQEWYVAREKRRQRVVKAHELAQLKKMEQGR